MSTTAICERTECANRDPHPGGVHLDPRHAWYDGPYAALGALPYSCKRSAQDLLAASRNDNWRRQVVDVALHDLAAEIHRRGRLVAAAQNDRDRGIREAMKQAEDCAVHGERLRHEGHQAYWFSAESDVRDEERIVWMTLAGNIRDVLAGQDSDVARTVIAAIGKTERAARSIRARRGAPTFADCQRAGKCEHPATEPHAACRRLAVAVGEAVADV